MSEFEIDFIIPGKPIALKRHRTVKVGNFTRNYDPSESDKKDFLVISMEHRPPIPYDEALYVRMYFYFPRPKSHYRTGQFSGELKESAPIYHTGTPDTDNLVKFVGDALEGKFWKNDSIIVQLQAVKKYSTRPRIHLQIRKIAGYKINQD